MIREVYTYPYPRRPAYTAVRRRNKKLVKEMSPVLVKFLSETYGGDGYAVERVGNIWKWDTLLLHMAYMDIDMNQGRIMAWPIQADPVLNDPIVDRLIGVKQG